MARELRGRAPRCLRCPPRRGARTLVRATWSSPCSRCSGLCRRSSEADVGRSCSRCAGTLHAPLAAWLELTHKAPSPQQGVLGAAASEAAKTLSHSLTFAINLAVLTNLTQHTFARTGRVRAGPTVLVSASVPLICADLFRHVLQDSGVWSSSDSHMYVPPDAASSCDPGAAGDALCRAPHSAGGFGHAAPWSCDAERQLCVCPEASIRCLSAVGWIFTILCTYTGFLCLFAGSCAGRLRRTTPPADQRRCAQACCGALMCPLSCACCCWRRDARVLRRNEPRVLTRGIVSVTPRRARLASELRAD